MFLTGRICITQIKHTRCRFHTKKQQIYSESEQELFLQRDRSESGCGVQTRCSTVEETLVTHAERVTGGKRSCEGAAVTACTVAGRVGVAHCGGNMTPAKSAVMPQEHARR